MRGPPVVLTNTLGRPVTNVISERGAVPMTVVNTLGEPVTLVNSGGEPVTLFNANGTLWDYPFSLFSNNEQGAWYDPSDFSTLFQNAAGTTPVTAVEQPVRLMLDRSRGLVLGSELWTAFGTITAPWTSVGGGVFSIDGSQAGNRDLSQSSQYVSGKFYVTTFTLSGVTGGTITVFAGEGNGVAYGNGAHTIRSSASQAYLIFRAPAGVAATVSAVSVRELPGNHALAPNDASRPVLRARYNLLTYSEQFDNAAWTKNASSVTANAGVAPDGTTTADTITENAANDLHVAFQTVGMSALTSHTLSVYLRAGTRNFAMVRVGGGGYATAPAIKASLTGSGSTTTLEGPVTSSSITAVGNGWYRVSMVFTSTAATLGYTPQFGPHDNGSTTSYTGDGVSGVLTWGAQLLTSADQSATGGAYQRIAAATDYDTSNPVWRPYLAFDGSDDSFSTSAIDFSGTDEMTVFAGVTKLSDAAIGIVAELSVSGVNGVFFLSAPRNAGLANYGFYNQGTGGADAISGSTFASPITSVLTGVGDISGDVATLRVNGTQVATITSDQGTGNYGNYPLFIGARNNASLRLNGRLYGLTVLGRTATAPELSAMEAWVNGKTGAY